MWPMLLHRPSSSLNNPRAPFPSVRSSMVDPSSGVCTGDRSVGKAFEKDHEVKEQPLLRT
jgi:hypothetical protein